MDTWSPRNWRMSFFRSMLGLEGSPKLGMIKYFMVWSIAFFIYLQLQMVHPQNLPTYFLVFELSRVLEPFFTTGYTLNKNKKTRDNSLSLIWSKTRKAWIYLASLDYLLTFARMFSFLQWKFKCPKAFQLFQYLFRVHCHFPSHRIFVHLYETAFYPTYSNNLFQKQKPSYTHSR